MNVPIQPKIYEELVNVLQKLGNAIFLYIENFLENEKNMDQLFLANKVNKCTMPKKPVPMGKILKIIKHTGTFI